MGEIAEMMLEGDLCEACGTALDGNGYGIPRYCSNECARDRGFDGIAPDGAGTYRKSKKVKQPQMNLLSVRITHDGGAVLPGGKKNVKLEISKKDAKILASHIEELVNRYQEV